MRGDVGGIKRRMGYLDNVSGDLYGRPTNEEIKYLAGSYRVYQSGLMYYDNGAVRDFFEDKEDTDFSANDSRIFGERRVFRAVVHGSRDYAVRLEIRDWLVRRYSCTCPAFGNWDGACKHVIAALKRLQKYTLAELQQRNRLRQGQKLFELFAPVPVLPGREPQRLVLEPVLNVAALSKVHAALELKVSEAGGRSYVVTNMMDFLRCGDGGKELVMGKALTIDFAAAEMAEGISKNIWQFLLGIYTTVRRFQQSGYMSFSWIFERKLCQLNGDTLEGALDACADYSFGLALEGKTARQARIVNAAPGLHLTVRPLEGAAEISLEEEDFCCLAESGRYVLANGDIFRVPAEATAPLRALGKAFAGNASLVLSETQMGQFMSEVLPQLEQVASVELDERYTQQYEQLPLTAELYCDYYLDGIAVRPHYLYGEIFYNPLTEEPPAEINGRLLVRDTALEKELQSIFSHFGFLEEEGQWVQPDEELCYEFLLDGVPRLTEIADVFYSDAFERKPLQAMSPVSVGVSVSNENLLEISLKNAQYDFDELVAILRSYRKKKRYHRLKDGSFVSLAEQQLDSLANFVEESGLDKGNREIGLAQAMYLDNLAEDEGIRMERSRAFRSLVQDIRHPQEAENVPQLPRQLSGILREYQKTGFAWLSALAHYRLGGILADDMGLGKTLEVISLLLAQKEEGADPSLVVAPTSLVYNWADEVQRFAPELSCVVVAGTKKVREQLLKEACKAKADFIVTTYNMLRSDSEAYAGQHFRYCFLDEAQHIKNPATKAAQAVKKLRRSCGVGFALTGTPIENNLTELWSIFDFIMPGFLLSHDRFRQRYELPIVRAELESAGRDLRRHIMPFVLRRLKKDVLTELPDKVESQLVNEMTAEQQKIYDAHFVQAQKEFREELSQRGFDASRIYILSLLTRLRQIVCEPALFLEDYKGGSGKLEQLEEVVGEAVAGGHRLLIFSQFTKMLGLIRARLEKNGIECFYLDGATPAKERIELVKAFNTGETPVFLISLKAGGTGLNLTGADMVIHYDPWWNPAVEDQATDRAYRIGQKNSVQVLKLVTKNTIEEKIFKLQQRKKALIDDIIKPGETFLSRLSEDEIKDLFS